MTITMCRTAAEAWQDGYSAGAASLPLESPELARRIAEMLLRMLEGAAPPRLLTVAQAAAQLGISKATLYELLYKGVIPSVQLPSPSTERRAIRRIEQSAIDALIAQSREVSTYGGVPRP